MEPTVEEVLKLTNTQTDKIDKKPAAIGTIAAFFLFPPWGVYLLWKEKTLHKLFGILSVISGLVYLLTNLTFGLNQIFLLFLCFLEIIFGIFAIFYTNKNGHLETYQLTVLTVLAIGITFLVTYIGVNLFFGSFQTQLDQYKLPANF